MSNESSGMNVQDAAKLALAKIEEGQKQAPAPEPEEAPIKGACPRCGFDEEAPNKPPVADMEMFTRCVLGGKPYNREYALAGGKVKFEFETLPADMADVMDRLLLQISAMNDLERSTVGVKMKLVFHMRVITLGTDKKQFALPSTMPSLEAVQLEYMNRFGKLGDPVLQMAGRTLMVFLDLQQQLLREAFDENFWKGVGPS